MEYKKVRIEKFLRGDRDYKVGEVLTSPIPSDILSEIRLNRGSVKVLEVSSTPVLKPVKDSETNLTSIVSDNEMDEKSLDEQLNEMFKKKEPAQVKEIEPETPKQEKGSEEGDNKEKVVKPAAKKTIPKRKPSTSTRKTSGINKLGKRKSVNDRSGTNNSDTAGS